jgi:hypothetical protein
LSQLTWRKGDEHGPFEGINPEFPWKDEGKARITSVKQPLTLPGFESGILSDAVTPTCTVDATDAVHIHIIKFVLTYFSNN